MSATQANDPMQPLKALFDQVKAAAQQECQTYHVAQLNHHLMRLARQRASADALATVIGMGATCVADALTELFRYDCQRELFRPTEAHQTWISDVFWGLSPDQCVNVLVKIVTSRQPESLVTGLFRSLRSIHHRLSEVDLTELFHRAVACRMVTLVDLTLPFVKSKVDVLNAALERAVEPPCQTLMFRLLEAGATDCVRVLKYLCAAELEAEIAVMLATRKVQPTLDCFDSLFHKYKWRLLPLRGSEDFARLNRIVQTLRLHQTPRPTPADDHHTYSVFQMFLDAPDGAAN